MQFIRGKIKKKLFILITFCLILVFVSILEVTLRLVNYGSSYELFVPTPSPESKYLGINFDAVKKYFSHIKDIPTPRKDLFLKEKPQNGYRIFVLGGSTAAGFPYGNNLTFSRILNRRLSDAYPEKKIEVINTAFTAINTYTQLDFMDEIIMYAPDAILIYTGHNEYYGALGIGSMESFGNRRWVIKIILYLKKFRIYQLMENSLSSIFSLLSNDKYDEALENPNATMMERIVRNKYIPFESDNYYRGIDQFRFNIRDILKIADENHIKVVISELVSNIRNHSPFHSINSEKYPAADAVYKQAVIKQQKGDYDTARKLYYQAKDLDALRFRAPEELNNIIHELAKEFNVPVVPMKSIFEAYSDFGIIGNKLMLEHLHPNKKGYFLMADAFFNILIDNQFIENTNPAIKIKSSRYYEMNWGFSRLDSLYSDLSIRQLKSGWPFKIEGTKNTFLDTFIPCSIEEELIVEIFKNPNMTLEKAHIKMAEHLKSIGRLDLAIEEYKALIYTVPYFDLFYEPALKLLATQNKYDDALQLIKELSQYSGENLFTHKWTAQIYLALGYPQNAIPYLELLLQFGGKEEILLYNLSRAYFSIGDKQNGDRVLNIIKQYFPNSHLIITLEKYKDILKN